MVKYCLTAMALKGFSYSPLTRRIYRRLGNNIGGKKRATSPMPSYYIDRINRMLRISRRFGLPKAGTRLIELGTGWCHWEALTTRLFFDVQATLYDVWDNRQISALKYYLEQLDGSLGALEIDDAQRANAHKMITEIKKVENYEQLYQLLGFEYVVDPEGKLSQIEKGSYDVAVSAGVLEHVYAKDAAEIAAGIAASLKPGGISIHSINIRDHLYLYDRTVSPKQYLQYSERVWNLCFQNDVQYINRIQRSEWLDLFNKSGLELLEEQVEKEDLSRVKVSTAYRKYEEEDLRCGGLKIVHRKPM
jgi:SAM-dependent methyltransferase